MENPPVKSFNPALLREPMARRLYHRAVATGQIRLPAVPGMIDEYVSMCDTVFAGVGVQFTAEELAYLRCLAPGGRLVSMPSWPGRATPPMTPRSNSRSRPTA